MPEAHVSITTMFKKVANKLATIPARGSSFSQPLPPTTSDPLQELIAAEELVLRSYLRGGSTHTVLNPSPPYSSLQGLRAGFDKTFEALKAWTDGKDVNFEVCPDIVLSPTCNS